MSTSLPSPPVPYHTRARYKQPCLPISVPNALQTAESELQRMDDGPLHHSSTLPMLSHAGPFIPKASNTPTNTLEQPGCVIAPSHPHKGMEVGSIDLQFMISLCTEHESLRFLVHPDPHATLHTLGATARVMDAHYECHSVEQVAGITCACAGPAPSRMAGSRALTDLCNLRPTQRGSRARPALQESDRHAPIAPPRRVTCNVRDTGLHEHSREAQALTSSPSTLLRALTLLMGLPPKSVI